MIDWSLRETRQKFYGSKEWLLLRSYILGTRPLCVFCLAKGIVTPATEVDHIIDIKDRPDLRLSPSNLQPLCQVCHNTKSSRDYSQSDKDMDLVNRKWKIEIKKI